VEQPLLHVPVQPVEHPPVQVPVQVEHAPVLLPVQVPVHVEHELVLLPVHPDEHELPHVEGEVGDVELNGPLHPDAAVRPMAAMAEKAFERNERRLNASLPSLGDSSGIKFPPGYPIL
jgi:hypothetical protein